MNEPDDRWLDVGGFIREQRRVGELSLRRLSELAGVSNPYLSQIERGLRKPSAEILRQIAQALHISAETLYVRAGILDDHSGEVDVVTEVRRDPTISDEQKRALVHIYQSFQEQFAAEQAAVVDGSPANDDPGQGDDDGDDDGAGPDGGAAGTGLGPFVPRLEADLMARPAPADVRRTLNRGC